MDSKPTAPQSGHPHRQALAPVAGEKRPLWSVMIPTHNCAHYLRETLASVLRQDPGLEMMQIEVIDDASTKDDPERVVAELGGRRVTFYRHPMNVGHVANFQTCLERSRGHYVHLLHGDDAVLEGFYDKIREGFERCPEAGAAFCRQTFINERGEQLFVSELERQDSGVLNGWLERLAIRQRIQTPSIVVRREVYERLGLFDRRLAGVAEDWEMWCRIAAQYPFWYEPKPLALYRMHGASMTSREMPDGQYFRSIRTALDIIQEHLPNDVAARLRRESLELWADDALTKMAPAYLAAKDPATAAKQVWEGLRCSRSRSTLTKAAKLLPPMAWMAFRQSAARRAPGVARAVRSLRG